MQVESRSRCGPKITTASTGPSTTPNQCGVHVENSTAWPGSMRLDGPRWTRLRTKAIGREMVGPNGEAGTMADNVMVLRRTG